MPTGIDYLDETWNPITGCSGTGCKVAHCWARDMVNRFPAIHGQVHNRKFRPYPFDVPAFHRDRLDKPLHWKKPRRVGVCFMGDWLDSKVHSQWIDRMIAVMFQAQHHQYFLLTKQPQRYQQEMKWINDRWGGFPECVWHGVSITDQEDLNRIADDFFRIPGKKWISWEPALGPIELTNVTHWRDPAHWWGKDIDLQWLVVGCESGPKRRPCPQEWMIDVVRQCEAAGIAVWVKQVDMTTHHVSHDPSEWPEELRVREHP